MHLAKRPILTEAETGLVGSWTMKNVGGLVLDGSGNANHGTSYGGVVTRKDSLLGDCMDWWNNQELNAYPKQYVSVADSVSLQVEDTITMSAWIYLWGTLESSSHIISKNSFATPGYALRINSANLSFYLEVGNDLAASPNNVLQLGIWQHIAVTYDVQDGFATFYVNGEDVGTSAIDDAIPVNNLALTLGIRSVDLDNGFYGMMANPKIYNRVLSSDEIAVAYRDTALAIQYMTNWDTEVSPSDRSTAGDDLEQSRWIIISGTWRITTDTINGNTVKVFTPIPPDDAKICIPVSWFKKNSPREAAFGAFRFYQKKHTDDIIRVSFISDGPYALPGSANGYSVYSNQNEQVYLTQLTPISDFAGPGTITAGAWHELAAIRYSQQVGTTDEFELYVDGVAIGAGGPGAWVGNNGYIVISVESQGDADIHTGNMISLGNVRGDYGIVKRFGNILR